MKGTNTHLYEIFILFVELQIFIYFEICTMTSHENWALDKFVNQVLWRLKINFCLPQYHLIYSILSNCLIFWHSIVNFKDCNCGWKKSFLLRFFEISEKRHKLFLIKKNLSETMAFWSTRNPNRLKIKKLYFTRYELFCRLSVTKFCLGSSSKTSENIEMKIHT